MEFFLRLPPDTYDEFDLPRLTFEIEQFSEFFEKYSALMIRM